MNSRILLTIIFCYANLTMAYGDEWTGTGFALKDKYIITNHHVVDGARILKVRGINGDFTKLYNAIVVAKDVTHDMAIIRIEDDEFNGFIDVPYTIKSGLSEVGEDVFVLGYPLMSTMGDEVKLTTGVVSSRSGFQGDVSTYQVSAPIQPGNSGGPLFDSNGNVIGIVNAKHGQAENVGYAIKSPYAHLFIQNNIGSNIIPSNTSLTGKSLADKVKKIKPYIFIIYASTDGSVNSTTTAISVKPPQYNPNTVYKVGDKLTLNGVVGVVFDVDASGKHGRVLSAMSVVCDWEDAMIWCDSLGENWYLPTMDELYIIYKSKDVIDYALYKIGYNRLLNQGYWSREVVKDVYAFTLNIFDGTMSQCPKWNKQPVRAVCDF